MKNIIKKIKENKLLTILLLITIISVILGILFPTIISESNKQLIKTSVKNFKEAIDLNKLNYFSLFIKSLSNNILVTLLILILGISMIGIFIIFLCLFIKGFLVGFSFVSILITDGISGILFSLIYTIPNIINLFISLLLSYYAVSFSLMIFESVFKKKNRNFQPVVKRYIKLSCLFLVLSFLISILESYVIPNILKFF